MKPQNLSYHFVLYISGRFKRYSFLISIQYVNFIEESMLRKIQGLLEKFVDTGIYGKITVYFEIKRMFYQMTSHPKSRWFWFFKIYSDHYFAWIRYTENYFAYSRRQVTSNNWKANLSLFLKGSTFFNNPRCYIISSYKTNYIFKKKWLAKSWGVRKKN